MKQLLHSHGVYTVVGINDRAFFGSPIWTTSTTHVDDHETAWLELTPPSPPPTQSAASSEAKLSDSAQVNLPPLDIQAVGVFSISNADSSDIWCAVARYDKSLSLYHIHLDKNQNSKHLDSALVDRSAATQGAKQMSFPGRLLKPSTVHRTTKRVSSLTFAQVPAAEVHESSWGPSPHAAMTVLVVADLAGDCTAYSLHHAAGPNTSLDAASPTTTNGHPNVKINQEPDEEGGDTRGDDGNNHTEEAEMQDDHEEEEEVDLESLSKHHRLLLGHTASILTGICVVGNRILTSDRDEKIRVSSFPATHIIEGYLLGHEAFVSSLAVPSRTQDGVRRCVSCGGDGTLRLWDFVSGQELAVQSLLDDQGSPLIPTRVSCNASGKVVAVIFDQCYFLDFFQVVDHETEQDELNDSQATVELKKISRYDCPAQPLSISFLDESEEQHSNTFLVLARESIYLQAYRVARSSDPSVWSVDTVDLLSCVRLREHASRDGWTLPTSIMERDKAGQLKMQKLNAPPGSLIQPWNDAARKDIARERQHRAKQRKKERKRKHEVGKDEDAGDP